MKDFRVGQVVYCYYPGSYNAYTYVILSEKHDVKGTDMRLIIASGDNKPLWKAETYIHESPEKGQEVWY